MTTCILTIIKNEHEYLDEWIKYHLNLGIDHIFIFEDIDSESHKEITDKYENKVSLNNIETILNENSKKRALELKSTKKGSAHILYLKEALLWIKENYENIYNWCFIIDNDEFITIKDTLNINDDYDAFIIKWECYGANGYINKPNYSEHGVIDTYTEKMKGKLIGEPYQTKVCFNIQKYKNEYFFNPHIPNKHICKWYNNDNIYIRHYITKSLEEYLWKKQTRGYIWGCRRNLDFFFNINPDMKDIKLVVLPYKQNGSQGTEIKLSLSAWKKFCKFKYHFIVIGEFDEQLKNEFPWVEFIYCSTKEKKEGQYNPHLDILNKFKIVSEKYSTAYNGFIYMTDDEYAVKPFNLDDITKIYYHSSGFIGVENKPTSYWKHDKWKTRQLLDKENLPHINYTTHYPCFFEFKKLNEICERFNMLEESYVFDDVYFNYFKHEEPILDNTIRFGIWSKEIFKNGFQNAVNNLNIKFMCNSVEGWSKELEIKLNEIITSKETMNELNYYLQNNKITKLQIGCGRHILNGWFNTDISVKKNSVNIAFMDAAQPFPIQDQTFDYIFSEHFFEHLTYDQEKTMLNECYRILKPNGIMRIATPNIEFLIDLYLNPEKEINKSYIEFDSKRSGYPINSIYVINRFHTTWGHKIIHSPESLTILLKDAGFKNIKRCEVGISTHIELNNIECHQKSFERQGANMDYNKLQTMVFEAQK